MQDDSSIESLLSAIRSRVEQECAEILSTANDEARRIHESADAETDSLLAGALYQAEKELPAEANRIVGLAAAARRRKFQIAKRQAIREAFDAATREMNKLPESPRYGEILRRLIREAAEAAGQGATVTVAADEEDICREGMADDDLGCTIETGDCPLGTVVAVSEDGSRRVDNSLATRMDRAKMLAMHEVAAVLFHSTDVKADS